MKQCRCIPCLVLLFCFCHTPLIAQYYNQEQSFIKANSVWAFGDKAGWDFNSGTSFTSAMNCWEGAGSVSDPHTGALLFYSSGPICFNRAHLPMPNGDSLLGNSSQPFNGPGSSIQGICIVPVIGKPRQYYLFSLRGSSTAAGQPSYGANLFYSVVDMSLDGGMGDIVAGKKNIPLNSDLLSEGMISVPGVDCDIWLIIHKQQEPVFMAYHITASGIDTSPVTTLTDTRLGPHYWAHSMAISPDLKKLAVAEYGYTSLGTPGGVLIYRFDNAGGTVSDPVQIGGIPNGAYLCAFSPDNTKLYMSYREDPVNFGTSMDIFQFDVSSDDSSVITASKAVVGHVDTTGNLPGYLRQYNGKIYITSASPYLHTISKPNLSGIACDFQLSDIPLGHQSRTALPNEVLISPVDTAYARNDSFFVCTINDVMVPLTLSAPPGSGYHWNDGSTGQTLTVTAPGNYQVSYQDQCRTAIDSFTVSYRYLTLDLGQDTALCDITEFKLNAGPPGAAYRWQDGSALNYYNVTEAGKYWVSVQDNNCTASDTVTIQVTDCGCGMGMPSAFSPNGDGINDRFLPVIKPDCRIAHYRLQVFNRYGQRVYLTSSPLNGWDGNYNSSPAEAGTYFYELSFSDVSSGRYYRKGDVTLIR